MVSAKDAEKQKLKFAEDQVQKSNFSLASSNLVTLDISGLQDMVAEIAEKVDVIHNFGQSSRDLITALQKEKEDMKDKLSAVQASLLAIKPLTSRIDKLTAEFSEYKIVTDEKMRKVAVSFAEMERHSLVPKIEAADAAPGPAGKGEKGARKTVAGTANEWTDLLENVKLSTAAIREIRTEHVAFGRQIETLQMQVRQLYELGAKKDDLQEVQDLVWKQGEKLMMFDTNYEAMLKSLEMIRLDTAGLTFSTTNTFEKHEQQISSLLTSTDNISQDYNGDFILKQNQIALVTRGVQQNQIALVT
ncbi:hypothetical protein CYMTET_23683 [Cymbomonas tetramitiformis]|uniref:Uncharacterized protein n=1 Tax=Cymbomonas tetramitiformis TaxID=36881 RepID=A0AAE0L0V6_9CHLO|nr:hypothetical protein CYMTET_23683 [Cymbomonas tetramitiformis]